MKLFAKHLRFVSDGALVHFYYYCPYCFKSKSVEKNEKNISLLLYIIIIIMKYSGFFIALDALILRAHETITKYVIINN